MRTTLRGKLLPPVLAIVFSVLLCTVALLISGDNPLDAFGAMIGQLFRGTTAVDTLNSGAVYYLAGLAVAIGFQMNLFNIGVEGQYRFAAVVAAIVGGAIALPPGIHTLVIIIVAIVAGALYALIPALLKVYRGVSEVISTIMLNAIAIGLIAYLVSTDAFGVQVGNNIATEPIPESGWMPGIPFGDNGTLFGFVFVAALVGYGYWVLLNRTRFGFELKASGESPTAATAGGVDARKMILTAMLLSGGVAGLTALPELLGRDHEYLQTSPAGYGFAGIAVALLGRNHPGGIALGAVLWAFLDKSAVSLDNVGVPQEITTIMQGAIVLSVVIAYEIVRRVELAAEQRRVGRQLGRDTSDVAAGGSV
ncbi:ABC transporter permease [Kibdelosporangium aridum]|uniref:ABC transporter permease n=1 Tax=Kibdelosporangium aridum TaxID=2030 RepID=A0A1W2CQ74_KIBAR|nr:ABC transporter permease [Kibdelosporangium aridum]RSM64643.1 ABC transporter permease [Kibdelosporangium aridum]SMC87353.1 simple sugar transport system permease protein [Kibdelosporangium aridum]